VLAIDIVSALFCAVLAALATRYFVGMPEVALRTLVPVSLVAVAVGAVAADLLTGVHKQIFRFTTLRVSFNLLIATLINAFISLLTLYVINVTLLHLTFSPKVILFYCGSYVILTYLVALALRGVMVFLARRLLVRTDGPISRKRIMVYGVKSDSPGVSSLIEGSTTYRMMGFVTNDPKVAGHEINGHRIYHVTGRNDLYLLKRTKSLDGILFTDRRDFLGEGSKWYKTARRSTWRPICCRPSPRRAVTRLRWRASARSGSRTSSSVTPSIRIRRQSAGSTRVRSSW